MPARTPTGLRTAIASVPGRSHGMVSPKMRVVIDAASRSISVARLALNPPQPAVAPVSDMTTRLNSGALPSKISAAFSNIWRRWFGPVLPQLLKASAAASHASFTSWTLAAAELVTTDSVTGPVRSKLFPVARSSPPICKSTSYICIIVPPYFKTYPAGAE